MTPLEKIKKNCEEIIELCNQDFESQLGKKEYLDDIHYAERADRDAKNVFESSRGVNIK